MYGIDISNWQALMDIESDEFDFAIIKTSEGIGFKDKSFDRRSVQLTELGKLIGCYHLARPDLNNSAELMAEEAKWFVECVEKAGLIGKAILVLDWEVEPLYDEELFNAFVETVINLTNVTPFIYASKSVLENMKGWEYLDICPIWIADWRNVENISLGPYVGFTFPNTNVDWQIYQYSNKGKFGSYSGDVDFNYALLTPESWHELASPREKELSEEMIWAITNEIVDEDITNVQINGGQLISILRKYTKVIAKQFGSGFDI